MKQAYGNKSNHIRLALAGGIISLLLMGVAYAFYYDMSASTGWRLNYKYGRSGISGSDTGTMTMNYAGSRLQLRGIAGTNALWNGWWKGRTAFFTNSHHATLAPGSTKGIVASPTNPFGVEFRRAYTRIDPQARLNGWNNPESQRQMAAQTFWLVRAPSIIDDSALNDYQTYPDYIMVYNMMRMDDNYLNGQPRATWGYFQSSEQRFNLSSVYRPDGSGPLSIVDQAAYTMEWNYEDAYGYGTLENLGDETYNSTERAAVVWTRAGNVVTVTNYGHGLFTGDTIRLTATSDAGATGAVPLNYTITVINANNFSFVGPGGGGASGTLNYSWGINPTPNNNNVVAVRLTHDGATVRFYLNPNAAGNGSNPYPNEFLYMGSAPVGWSENLLFMTGMECHRFDSEKTETDITNVTVRSVASTLKAELSPGQIAKGSTNWYDLVISPTLGANDAGIGELTIAKPASWSAYAWSTLASKLEVYSYYGAGTNHAAITGQCKKMTLTGSLPATGEAYVLVDSTNLRIRFRQTSDGDNNVVNGSTGGVNDRKIVVRFNMGSPDTANGTGDEFLVYADCVKYQGQAYSRWGTTGRIKAIPANTIDHPRFADDSLLVKSYNNPAGLMNMSPGLVYVGNDRTVYFYLATADANASPVSELRIKAPAGYVLNTNDNSRYSSLYINNDSTNVYAEKVGSDYFVVVRYRMDNTSRQSFPSAGGLDRITIKVESTPTNFSGPQTNTVWTATVYSAVQGSGTAACGTNATYPNRTVTVRQLPPVVQASLSTALYQSGTNYVYNHVKLNQVTYTIQNNGTTGNNIKRVLVKMPTNISSLDSYSSLLMADGAEPANINYETNTLIINYAGAGIQIPPGGSDVLTLWTVDTVTPMSAPVTYAFTCKADNGNGDLFVPSSEGSATWKATWKSPPAAGTAMVRSENAITPGYTNNVYTSDASTVFKVTLNNTGGAWNRIRLAEITVPAVFTNLKTYSSAKLSSQANITRSGNVLYVKYHADAVMYLDNADTDTITFTGVDNVALVNDRVDTFQVRVGNTTNVADLQGTGNFGQGNKDVNFIRPPVSGGGVVRLVAGQAAPPAFIDASTNRTTITYVISNRASFENYLGEARIWISTNLATNIVAGSLASTRLAGYPANISSGQVGASNYIKLIYHGAAPLYGGTADTVTFTIGHNLQSTADFPMTAQASNVRNTWTALPAFGSATNWVTIKRPPANARARVLPGVFFTTSTMVTNLVMLSITNLGTADNHITNVVVTCPDNFKNNILYATNQRGMAIAGGITYTAGQGKLTCHYQASLSRDLKAGTADTLYIWFRNNVASQLLDKAFTITADNGRGAVAVPAWSGYWLAASFVNQPTVEIAQADASPNQVYTTDSVSTFTYTLRTGASGGRRLNQLRILLPRPFVNDSIVVNSPWPGSAESTVPVSGQTNILVNYTLNPMDSGSSDPVTVTARDEWVLGTTNVTWSGWVDYGDGYGWRTAAVAAGKSIGVAFVFPDATAQAAFAARQVNMNNVSTPLSVTISNTGVPGNAIKRAEIDLGNAATNVGGVITSALGAAVSVVSNRVVRLDYAAASTNIPSGKADTVSFTLHDNIAAISNVTVKVRVSNTTNAAQNKLATELYTDGLRLSFYRPDYVATWYVRPKTPIAESKPFSILSTVTTSTLEVSVVNNGAAGNNLDVLRIWIPAGVFDPATISGITSGRVGPGRIVRTGNLVTVYYTNAGEPLLATQGDTIRFAVNDLVASSNASARFVTASRFTTSGSTFLTNSVASGQTNAVLLEMPAPSGMARLRQPQVYTTSGSLVLAVDVTNTGAGSNNLTSVQITVPAALRAGLAAASITNGFAASRAYAAGVFTLTYTNFTVGKADRVYLVLTNGYASPAATSFTVTLGNGALSAAAAEWTTGALQFAAVTPPSGYMEIPSPRDGVYNRLWSTDWENTYKVYVNNDGTGTASVNKVRVLLPSGFTLTGKGSSRVAAGFLTQAGDVLTVDYQAGGAPLAVSESDVLTLTMVDPYHGGATNRTFALQVGDIDPLSGLNPGWSASRLYSGKSWQASYVHPPVSAQWNLVEFTPGKKPEVLVAPKNGIAATNLSITLRNTGSQSNVIARVRFAVPAEFSAVSNLSSAAVPGAGWSFAGGWLTVDYGVKRLAAGATETVDATFYYSVSDATNNLVFSAQADNGDGAGWTAVSTAAGKYDTLDVKYPPIAVFAGVRNAADVFTINTNAVLQYDVRNRAQGFSVMQVRITNFALGVFSNVTAVSTRPGAVVTVSNNFITAVYAPGAGIDFNALDTITINLRYRITNDFSTTLSLPAVAWVTNPVSNPRWTNIAANPLEKLDTDNNNADNQRVRLRPAPYARVAGAVLPSFKVDKARPGAFLPNIVKVEVLGLSNNDPVTTPWATESGADGRPVPKVLQTYSDPSAAGAWTLDVVPSGSYRLRFSSAGFRITLTNIAFVSNRVMSLPSMVLKNDYLDTDSSRDQVVVDYGDTNTRFTLPSGDLLDQFSLDISVVDMNTAQEAGTLNSRFVLAPGSPSALGCFKFTVRDRDGNEPTGISIGGDGVLQLHYLATGLNLPLPGTWQEPNLAIFYWKETTGEWVPVGGAVDSGRDTVTAKVNYLHRYYAVLSINPAEAGKAIFNVKASPNPFTPGRGGEDGAKMKLTFSLAQAAEKYTVSILNLRGQLVKRFERGGEYKQGEVFWDGRHENGFQLPGGVYLYQIKAGDQVFTGTVLMLK